MPLGIGECAVIVEGDGDGLGMGLTGQYLAQDDHRAAAAGRVRVAHRLCEFLFAGTDQDVGLCQSHEVFPSQNVSVSSGRSTIARPSLARYPPQSHLTQFTPQALD
jgi:hypothetical protein